MDACRSDAFLIFDSPANKKAVSGTSNTGIIIDIFEMSHVRLSFLDAIKESYTYIVSALKYLFSFLSKEKTDSPFNEW